MALVKPRIPGFQDGGNAVEPTTGNDVPVGSLPNEVADDIPAKLSEGEFILPADVVRFIGLERLMKMRDEAKEGLRRMAEIGQMGNAEEVGERSDDSFEENDDEFESNIDSIMAEMEKEKPENEQTERMMAVGGYMSGTDIGKAPKNPAIDVRFLRHADGRVMYITYINGKPMTPIPEGFRQITREEAVTTASAADEARKEERERQQGPVTGQEGPEAVSAGPVSGKGQGDTLTLEDLSSGTTVSPTAVKGAGIVATVLGIPGAPALTNPTVAQNVAAFLTNQSGVTAGKTNLELAAAVLGVDPTTVEGRNAAMQVIDDLGMSAGLPSGGGMTPGTLGVSTSMADMLESGAAGAGPSTPAAPVATSSPVSPVGPDISGGNVASVGGIGGIGDISGMSAEDSPFAKGGLVNKRQKPPKKQKGKGLASR